MMRVQRERSRGFCLRIDPYSRKLWYEIHLDLFYETAGLLTHSLGRMPSYNVWQRTKTSRWWMTSKQCETYGKVGQWHDGQDANERDSDGNGRRPDSHGIYKCDPEWVRGMSTQNYVPFKSVDQTRLTEGTGKDFALAYPF